MRSDPLPGHRPQEPDGVPAEPDQPAVRRMTWLVLEQGGAAILDAGTGEAALALAGQYTGPIHLRLTDLVMPGMSGREVAEQAADFLPRPFTAGALTARVCGLLDR